MAVGQLVYAGTHPSYGLLFGETLRDSHRH